MTKEEANEILQMISEMYPKFQVTRRKAILLVPNLKKMDYQGVLKNLSLYVMNHPFPPTLQDIAAYPKEEDAMQQMIAEWEREAENVSPELRDRFVREFEQLLYQLKGEEK